MLFACVFCVVVFRVALIWLFLFGDCCVFICVLVWSVLFALVCFVSIVCLCVCLCV